MQQGLNSTHGSRDASSGSAGNAGILERGAKLGKINFRNALGKLEQTKFRVSPTVRVAFLGVHKTDKQDQWKW